jgi:hypothetical protein
MPDLPLHGPRGYPKVSEPVVRHSPSALLELIRPYSGGGVRVTVER